MPPPRSQLSDPPDRGCIDTEQRNHRSKNLDTLSIRECVRLINEEDMTVAPAVRDAEVSISEFITSAAANMKNGGRLIYLGAGTSGRLGVLDSAECPPTFQTDPGLVIGLIAGGNTALRKSSEYREDDPDGAKEELELLCLDSKDTVLGIAAGGTTPYVLGGLKIAQKKGAVTGLLCCTDPPEPLVVDHLIIVRTGPEIITGSTRMKAGTATKMVLNTISTTIMVQMGKVHDNLMVDLRASNDKLRDRAVRIISELTGIDRKESLQLLSRARGCVKQAVLMQTKNISFTDADSRLKKAEGILRKALED